jgi:hypothetical protein
MPIAFRERGDVSLVALLRESGYLWRRATISEVALEEHLRAHSDLVDEWLRFSEDQRCSPAWYLVGPGRGAELRDGWRVGVFTGSKPRPAERVFQDGFTACAFFVKRQAEDLRRYWLQRAAVIIVFLAAVAVLSFVW